MFFQLPQFEKFEKYIQILQTNKQSLQSLVASAYSPQQKVNNSLCKTLQQIMNKTYKDIKELNQIQDDIDNGFMIPEEICVNDLMYQREGLPQWFQFVFQKEFLKQKKNFDVVAKKTYKIHGLHQKKEELQIQAQSFKILYQRFTALNGKQKQALNIMSEAQSLKNKTNLLKQKYIGFCQLLASKILYFIEQNCNRALKYHGQIQDFAQKSSFGFQNNLYANINYQNQTSASFINNQRSRVGNFYNTQTSFMNSNQNYLRERQAQNQYTVKQSLPITSTGYIGSSLQRQKSRIGTLQSPNTKKSFLNFYQNQNHHNTSYNFYNQPSLRSINTNTIKQSGFNQNPSHENYNRNRLAYGTTYTSHTNLPTMTYGNNQHNYNYRNYVPRWSNTNNGSQNNMNTLTNYYY